MDTARNSTDLNLGAAPTPRTSVVAALTTPPPGAPPKPKPASREVTARRLEIALRDFTRVGAVLSTCRAALPAECTVGEPDVGGTLEVAERMLYEAIAGLERIHD